MSTEFSTDEPSAPSVTEQLKRRVIKLGTAWSDLDKAGEIADAITRRFTSLDAKDAELYGLETACVICYVRPFTYNEGLGPLKGKLCEYDNPEHQTLHSDLVALRNKIFAHSDINYRKMSLQPNAMRKPPEAEEPEFRFLLSFTNFLIPLQRFLAVRKMCDDRKGLIWEQLQAVLLKLYPIGAEPSAEIDLNCEVFGK